MTRRTVRMFAVAVGAVAVVAGCGLPKDGSPREIAADHVPFGLLGPSTTAPSNEVVQGGTVVLLYFVDGSKLRAVQRRVERPDIRIVLDQLVKGITDTDPLAIRTAIPKDTKVLDTSVQDNTVTVTLSAEILSVASTEQRNAFAQFVYTASDLKLSGIRFRVVDANGNNPQEVQPPTDAGTHPGPFTIADYGLEAPQQG